MPTHYDRNTDLDELVEALLRYEEFSYYRDNSIEVVSALLVKTNKDGECVKSKTRAALKKVNPLFSLFFPGRRGLATYIVVVDNYIWSNSDRDYVSAAVHHALMSLEVHIKDSGEIVLKKRALDVAEYRRTARRYGTWNEDITLFTAALAAAGDAAAAGILEATGHAPNADTEAPVD